MSRAPLSPNTDFTVKDDVMLNFLVGGLCFVFFIISLINWSGLFTDYFAIIFFLGPAILFMVKGWKNKIIIRINKQGIYYQHKLLTNWENFMTAQITEDQKFGSISDNFVLVIKCYNTAGSKHSDRKIKLGNTQSKSEESILAAIRYYNKIAKE